MKMLFKDDYQKEMTKIRPSPELIAQTKAKVLASAPPKRHRPLFRSIVALATAAAIISLMVLSGNFTSPTGTSNNSFILTTYAAEQQQDGTMTGVSPLGTIETDVQHAYFTQGLGIFADNGEPIGTTIRSDTALGIMGENISSVTISVDKGYFAMIRTDNYSYWYAERIGTTRTISGAELVDSNSMVLWEIDIKGDVRRTVDGTLTVNGDTLPPKNITITAVVTFEDGEVQEKTIEYEISGIPRMNSN